MSATLAPRGCNFSTPGHATAHGWYHARAGRTGRRHSRPGTIAMAGLIEVVILASVAALTLGILLLAACVAAAARPG